jgi:hypothetical protein
MATSMPGLGASGGRNSDPTNVSTTAQLDAQPRASLDAPTLWARRAPRNERTPEEYGSVLREDPNVGAQTLQGRQLFAAKFSFQHDADKYACNRKCVRRSFLHQTGAREKLAICRLSYSGGGIRTRDLRVMSPTSYQTAPPRGGLVVIAHVTRL